MLQCRPSAASRGGSRNREYIRNWVSAWLIKMLFIYIVGCLFFRRVASSALWLPAGFRTWRWQSSIVVDSFLYISGGEIQHLSPAGILGPIYNNATYAMDLSSSWTVFTSPPPKKVNVYRGEEYGKVDWSGRPTVWSFPPDNATSDWSLRYRKGDTSSFGQMTSKAKGMTARSPKAFFHLGGFANTNSDTVFPPDGIEYAQSGLLTFQNEGEVWTKDTLLTSQPSFMLNGEAQFVPLFAEEGVIVFIGGDRRTKQLYVAGGSMVGRNTITLYDVGSKTFYEQKTRGPIPLQRNFFCSGGTSGADNRTWEIIVYGGVQGAYSTFTDSLAQEDLGIVHILFLPSCTWTSFANKNKNPFGRFGHGCSIIGSRQMLSVGGLRANSSDLDTFENDMKIFDMSTLEWKNTFDTNAKHGGSIERDGLCRVCSHSRVNRKLEVIPWHLVHVKHDVVMYEKCGMPYF
ncbi:hypothetical protein VTL71DRAFT_5644 [Oculimacula yallundae]|uniref:Kelch repeat protein n=1 Tax=Oculimacula yallundae TaxID=86028 RepID=A0ABR4BY78_9HELO